TDAQSFPETGGFGGDGATSCNPCSDFPATPILDPASGPDAGGPAVTAAPPNSATLFGGAAGTGTGPCVFEPEVGTLFPNNWLRPRFRYVTGGSNLFEIRLHTAKEANDLVVYTRSDRWTMPKDMWLNLAAHVQGDPITMTVRGAVYDDGSGTLTSGPVTGTSGDVSIAPAPAQGSIVYWVTSTMSLKGFQIGDEGVSDVVAPAQASDPDAGLDIKCVGCHSSAGDGKYVITSASIQANSGNPASIAVRSSDGTATAPDTSVITDFARGLLNRQTQQVPVSSSSHFVKGDRVVLSNYNGGIIWTDLEATSADPYSGTGSYAGKGWGILTRDGDAKQAGGAAFSHDGKTIAYMSAGSITDGINLGTDDGDIRTIPWNDRKGGTSAPLVGASDPAYDEFYPTFAPGDKVLAFSRVPIGNPNKGVGYNYAQTATEVFAIPASGGTATRLAANDPPACLSQPSPGVSNSWPKWAPASTDVGGKTYDWVVFSSTRQFGYPQLYLSSVVVDDATGAIDASHAALHIWNQPEAEHNHTPAWDYFSVPPSGPR
ncbi:MAG: hypothetical protein ABI551_14795, partial [Polyangiaceae bacterium]